MCILTQRNFIAIMQNPFGYVNIDVGGKNKQFRNKK